MIGLDAARAALAPLDPILVEAHRIATQRWFELCEEDPIKASPCNDTTRAGFLHDHIEFEVARLVEGLPGVKIADGMKFMALLVEPGILLRFKYVGRGAPSNVATQQQQLLAQQSFSDDMLEAIEALVPPTLLTCGYTLDEGQLDRIEIRRDCKHHSPWFYDIFGGETIVQPMNLEGLEDLTKPARISKPGKKRERDDLERTA